LGTQMQFARNGCDAEWNVEVFRPAIGFHVACHSFIEPTRDSFGKSRKECVFPGMRRMGNDAMREFMRDHGTEPFRCPACTEREQIIVQNTAHPNEDIFVSERECISCLVIVRKINTDLTRKRRLKIRRDDAVYFLGDGGCDSDRRIQALMIDEDEMIGFHFLPMEFRMIRSGNSEELRMRKKGARSKGKKKEGRYPDFVHALQVSATIGP